MYPTPSNSYPALFYLLGLVRSIFVIAMGLSPLRRYSCYGLLVFAAEVSLDVFPFRTWNFGPET